MKLSTSYLTLKLTNRCNMNCAMCGQTAIREKQTKDDLPLEIVQKRMNEINTIETVYLFGGEPLLYEKFPELLEYLKNKNINILISSNGLMLKKYTELIISAKVRDLTISIDSHRENVFAAIRGKNVLPEILENVRYIINKKKELNSEYPYIGINCVILPENLKNLNDIYCFLNEQFPELDRINFEKAISTNLEMGKSYEKIMREELNINATSWKWFLGKAGVFSSRIVGKIETEFEKLKQNEKVTFLAPERFDDSEIPSQTCPIPDYALTVLPNGNVVFCTDFPDYVIGNIKENTLNELLNNKKAKLFRTRLGEKGKLPICVTCPRRYDSGTFLINTKWRDEGGR